MTQPASSAAVHPAPSGRPPGFGEWRTRYDARVLGVYSDRNVRRTVKGQNKTNLLSLWNYLVPKLEHERRASRLVLEPLQIHETLVEGLPGEALFVAAAMSFDSMSDALQLFGLSSKTARQRIGDRLSVGESEIALRIGRALTMAADLFESMDDARNYLRAPNFALGGAAPRDLLMTAEGEQLVLSELNAQAEGGPV